MENALRENLNSHIVERDGWRTFNGVPRFYLNWVLHARNTGRPYAEGKEPWPAGKLPFDNFVKRNRGRAPRTIALINEGKVLSGRDAGSTALEFLQRLPDGNYFCKQFQGGQGVGAVRLDVTAREILTDGEKQAPQALSEKLSARAYVIQESLTAQQHRDIACFHASCTNTLRLVTYVVDGVAKPVSAFLRISTRSPTVDNWAAGGVAVPVDLEKGVLGRYGIIKKGLSLLDTHPGSGLVFEGRPLPHWNEAVALANRLHLRLGAHSLGWDIALLRDEPCIVECNRFWDPFLGTQLAPHFVPEFLDFHLPKGTFPSFRLHVAGEFADRHNTRKWVCELLGRALVSGRVERFSTQEIVIAIAGPNSKVEKLAKKLRNGVYKSIKLSGVQLSASKARVSPGLDGEAMIAG
jgi:hypothetical protein